MSSAWSEHRSPEGRPYFYNQVTQESTWERPAELAGPVPMPPVPYAPQQYGGGFNGGGGNQYAQQYGGGHQHQGQQQQYGGYGPAGYGPAGYGPGPGQQSYGEPQSLGGPGAPIQKGKLAQGPPGSNLFVFHIPNQMTTRQLYDLFAPFGNVISSRIMVERDTGRSRGFGFVSYDNPESADAAIRALDGFSVYNKRLKVSHKKEGQDGGADWGGPGGPGGGGGGGGGRMEGGGPAGPRPSGSVPAGSLPPTTAEGGAGSAP